MKLVPEETSLVIAGAWNPAIITPVWVLENAYHNPDAQIPPNIQAFMPVGIFYAYPRYSLGQLDFVASNESLAFHPTVTDQIATNKIEETAANIVEMLSHTPLVGIGHNFEFVETVPTPEQLKLFNDTQEAISDSYPENFTANATQITAVLSNPGASFIINITHYFDGNKIGVKLNFHHQLNNATQALAVLRPEAGANSFYRNYELAQEIVTSIYGELNNEHND